MRHPPWPVGMRRNLAETSTRRSAGGFRADAAGPAGPVAPTMEFLLLGPVEVRVAGRPVDAGPPRQRSVLAALAVDAGRPVPVSTLVDRVWGDAPPNQVRHALHVYVGRIRGMIRDAGAGTAVQLERRSQGYLLGADPDLIDVQRFRRLVGQAGDRDRPAAERSALLRQALALWRDTPLSDLGSEWAARMRAGWQQQRVTAVLEWAELELGRRQPAGVVAALTDLIAEHPLLEQPVSALMRALHHAGRSAEAVEVYAAARGRLVEALGVDPGPELQDLHRAILRGELHRPPPGPAAAGHVAPGPAGTGHVAPGPAGRLVPAQLPTGPTAFTGRESELATLDRFLAGTPTPVTGAAVVVVSGTAGVGKTALAVHWAHRVADRFPDGQLHLNLRGFGPDESAMGPVEAVRVFLDALGVPAERIPDTAEAQIGRYRSLTAGRRLLILLDNARDAAQVRPLLPGSAGCLVVVTSRDRCTSLVAAEGAGSLTLDLLPVADARQLLARRIGPVRIAAEPEAAEQIVARCARLPLALAVVAARIATNPTFPLGAVAAELAATHGDLDAFDGGDVMSDVRAAFSWSCRTLSPAAMRLFALLALHPGPDLTAPAAASLADVPRRRTRTLLAELTRAHLITETTPGRYAFHDLLRTYAGELAGAEPATERDPARRRALDHYLHTAFAAAVVLQPQRDPIELPPAGTGVVPEPVPDADAAIAWFTRERAVLMAVLAEAARDRLDADTWRLGWCLAVFLPRRGYWHDWVTSQRSALEAARRMDEPVREAQALRGLARAYALLERYDDALVQLQRAGQLYQRLGDDAGVAAAHVGMSWVYERQHDYGRAVDHAQRGLELYRRLDHRNGQAYALNNLGSHHSRLGDHRQAVESCRQSIALHREVGDRRGEADAWDSLGYAHQRLGDHRQAVSCYGTAIELYVRVGDRYLEAEVLTHLGDAQQADGDLAGAQRSRRRALEILDDLNHPAGDAVRATPAPADGRPPGARAVTATGS